MRTETQETRIHRDGLEIHVKLFNTGAGAIYPRISKTENSNSAHDIMFTEGNFGTPTTFDQGTAVPEDDINTPYFMNVYWKLRGIKHKVSSLAAQSDKYKVIAGRKDKLALAMRQGREVAVAGLFTNATSTAAPYVLADGKALVASDHPLASGSQSNLGVASSNVDLSYANAQSALQEMLAHSDHRGNPIMYMGKKKLIVPPGNAGLANIIADAMGRQPQTANNDMNWAAGQISEVVVDPFITDSDSWFLQGDNHGQRLLVRQDVTVAMWIEPDTANSLCTAIWEAYTPFNRDWRDFQGSVGA